MCLGVFSFGLIPFGTLSDSWTWVAISFPILGKFSTIISSIFSWLSVFFFWDSYDLNVGVFDIVPEVSEVALISFNSPFFPLCLSNANQTQRANIKSSKRKQQITHKGTPIRITADLSIETLQARREW